MATNSTPEQFYKEQLSTLTIHLHELLKRKRILGWTRFSILAVTAFCTWYVWSLALLFSLLVIVLGVALFLFAVKKDLTNHDTIKHCRNLIALNEEELQYLQHRFTQQKDGHEFYHEEHPYAGDLDIFGRASLYQYINRTTSQQGNNCMAEWLLEPADAATITARQQAIKELCSKTNWRQELQAIGRETVITSSTEKKLEAWLKEENLFVHKAYWHVLRFIVPAVALTTLFCFLVDVITYQRFLQASLLFALIAFGITRSIVPLYRKLNKITGEMETLSNSINCIEQAAFTDPLLLSLQQQFHNNSTKASKQIFQLKQIFNRFDYRLNPVVFIPLNIFLLWDLQLVLQLEAWKKKNNQQINHWFSALAELETLGSLATLAFNHPHWRFPVLQTNEPVFDAVQLGHPLIESGKNVLNDFTTKGQQQINLITGSNMAGKSTFLRSVGVNMVLACMGAPVCAKQLTVSPLKVMSSMRIKDNLEENTSTFYAELKKLKQIIDAVNNNEAVFILLDEILRGTNSNDRHTGSKALIKQLLLQKATGILATHDLELAKLADEYPATVHNYHFDVQVNAEELYFDYKIKRGVCQSMNASILMKKIGIEL
ncbi:MutS-like protein [Lacibacter cauensis]|uniref:MutS-like protein n=1 Tax=Lacibacter cauensis TaxID=510947 RepID=A0A562SAN5_9BACT|nr:MutS family DNA mismatch repair protein [Lacibacter cauensis]TWI78328.1 MutS-like protein [Lacibacter cauensis]